MTGRRDPRTPIIPILRSSPSHSNSPRVRPRRRGSRAGPEPAPQAPTVCPPPRSRSRCSGELPPTADPPIFLIGSRTVGPARPGNRLAAAASAGSKGRPARRRRPRGSQAGGEAPPARAGAWRACRDGPVGCRITDVFARNRGGLSIRSNFSFEY